MKKPAVKKVKIKGIFCRTCHTKVDNARGVAGLPNIVRIKCRFCLDTYTIGTITLAEKAK